ncbi:MAG: leucine-rich repeat domain-containing protein [Acholeplasmatales bacterium]|nr:leucine-rich repeat domain-containing protein [Acholeplasmatales bacterium]
MKKVLAFIVGLASSVLIVLALASCGTSAETKLGMTKAEVKDLYSEAPTYENNNTLYWCDDDFIDLLKKYGYELGVEAKDNYQTIRNAITESSDLAAEVSELHFRFRFAKFSEKNKLIEFYYDFDHKFTLSNDEENFDCDYESHAKKTVKEIDLSKSRLDYYLIEDKQFKNNKNKASFSAYIVDYENITYDVDFSDGSLYKSYLASDLDESCRNIGETDYINKKSNHFTMLTYVDSGLDTDTLDFSNLTDEMSAKLSYKFAGGMLEDYNVDLSDNNSELFNGRCVGLLAKTKTEGKYSVYKWTTKKDFLPLDIIDENVFEGTPTTKILNNVIYEGYVINPYYRVVGVNDKSLATYELQDGVIEIAAGALSNLTRCYKIELPKSVKTIDDYAIVNDTNLVSISIPSSVEEFGEINLIGCPKLLEIVNGSKVVTEAMAINLFTNGTGFFRTYDDYEKNGFVSVVKNNYIFADIQNKKTIINNLDDGVYLVGTISLNTNITLPDSVNLGGKSVNEYRIYRYAFANNTRLNEITMPSSVISIEDNAFDNCSNLRKITADGVKTIGSSVFNNCKKLSDISFNKVTSIGSSSFQGIDALTEVTLPSLTYIEGSVFSNCVNLETVDLPNLTSINDSAFNNCKKLTTVNAPKATHVSYSTFNNCINLTTLNTAKLNDIRSDAFNNCKKLTSITIDDSNLYIDDNAITNSAITLYEEDGIKYLSSLNNKYAYLFEISNTLDTVAISESVAYVRAAAFYNLTNLRYLTVNDNITFSQLNNIVQNSSKLVLEEIYGGHYIGSNSNPYLGLVKYDKNTSSCNINANTKYIFDNAFKDSIIESISWPTNLEYVGNNAFSNCDSLTTVTIPNGLSFESATFSDCDNLTTVTFNGNTYITEYMFNNCAKLISVIATKGISQVRNNAFENCTKLENIDLSQCSEIWSVAFKNCSSLNNIDLRNAYNISDQAFYNCSSLTSVNLANINTIGYQAFANCSELEEVSIGANLWDLGGEAFDSCINLKNLALPKTLSSFGSGVLDNCSKLAGVTIPLSVLRDFRAFFGNAIDHVDLYVTNTLEELEAANLKLSYLELNQKLYIYSETEPTNQTSGIRYWHYDNNDEIAIW